MARLTGKKRPVRTSLAVLALFAASQAAAGTSERETIRLNQEGMPAARMLEGDPNVMICTRQHLIGSRLNAAQVCKTRGEWIAQRDDIRRQVASGQFRQTNPNGEGGSTGNIGMFQPCRATHGC